MEIRLDYGEGDLSIDVDERRIIHIMEKDPVPVLDDIEQRFLSGFRDPIGSPPLKELISGKKKICIVISDSTRAVPTEIILGQLLPEIESYGIMTPR